MCGSGTIKIVTMFTILPCTCYSPHVIHTCSSSIGCTTYVVVVAMVEPISGWEETEFVGQESSNIIRLYLLLRDALSVIYLNLQFDVVLAPGGNSNFTLPPSLPSSLCDISECGFSIPGQD